MKPTNEALKNYQLSDISYDKGANLATATFTEDLTSNDKSSLKEIIVDIFGVKPGWSGQNGLVLNIPEKQFNEFQKLLILDLQMKLVDEEVASEASDSSSPNLGNGWNETPDGHMSINVDQGKVQGEFTIIPETEETFKLLWSPREFNAGDIEVDNGLPTVEAAKEAAESYAENHLGIGDIYEAAGGKNESAVPVVESFSSVLKGMIIVEGKSDEIPFIGRNDMEKDFAKEAFNELGEDFWKNAKEADFEIEEEDIESAEGEEVWSVLHDHTFTGLGGATEEEARENLRKALAIMQDTNEAKDTDDNDIVDGDQVIVVGRTDQEGKKGTVVETSDSSDFVIVEIKGKNYSYHASDLRKVDEEEEDEDDEVDFDTENTYEYVIDLDERGDFQAHIEDVDGDVVYEIEGIDDLQSLIEDGFMKSKDDTDGLLKHLQDVGILDKYAILESIDTKIDKFLAKINEDMGDDDQLALDNSEPEYEVFAEVDGPVEMKTIQKVAQKLEIPGSPDTGFIVGTKVLLRKFVNTLRGFDLVISKILDGHNNEVALASIEAYKPKGRPTNKYNYPNRMHEAFKDGSGSHFDSLLKEWGKKNGVEYEMKFKDVRGRKNVPYFVLKLTFEQYDALPTDAKTALSGLLKQFGVDFSYRNKTWTPIIEANINEEKLIKGAALTPEQKKLVLAAFVYRNTKENEPNVRKALKDKADAMKFDASDDKWIEDHAFWFNNDGKTLSGRKKHAEPHYLAD